MIARREKLGKMRRCALSFWRDATVVTGSVLGFFFLFFFRKDTFVTRARWKSLVCHSCRALRNILIAHGLACRAHVKTANAEKRERERENTDETEYHAHVPKAAGIFVAISRFSRVFLLCSRHGASPLRDN